MIQAVIFSKDRACQLDLLLRSIRMFWINYKEFKITVIYNHSSKEFESGYMRLMARYPEFSYCKESNIQDDIIKSLDVTCPYTMFFVDDDLFVREWNIKDKDIVWDVFVNNKDISCLSLRLGANIFKNYESGTIRQPMDFMNDYPYIWEWRKAQSDFGYPGSVDGHVFRTIQLLKMLQNVDHCCNIEPILMRQIELPYMTCYHKSKIVNVPNNMVQGIHNNQHMNGSVGFLNERYLLGEQIKIEPFVNIENDSCHYPMEYQF